jgi:hypothetical protein
MDFVSLLARRACHSTSFMKGRFGVWDFSFFSFSTLKLLLLSMLLFADVPNSQAPPAA